VYRQNAQQVNDELQSLHEAYVGGLAQCEQSEIVVAHDAFSYPLLAASYRYGPSYVRQRGFDLSQLRKPKNKIYQRIFAGMIRPVSPPRSPPLTDIATAQDRSVRSD